MITFKEFITEAFKPIPFIEGGDHRYVVAHGNWFDQHMYNSKVLVGSHITNIHTTLTNRVTQEDNPRSMVSFSVSGKGGGSDIKRTHSEATQIFNTVLGHIEHHMKLVSPTSLSFSPLERISIRGNIWTTDHGEGRRKIFQRMADQFGVKVNA